MIVNNIEITAISNDYKGICEIKNKKCFVDGGIIGDIVNIEIYKETSKFYCAKILKIIKKSTFREENVNCEFFKKCGGCLLQHLRHNYYCNLKKDNFYKDFLRTGFNFDKENINFYTVGCGKRRRINLKYNNGIYGFFGKSNNNVTEINKCINVNDNINEITKLFNGLKFTNLNSVDIFEGYNGIAINLIFNKEPNINEFKKLDVFKDKVCYINYTYLDKNAFIPIIQNNILTLKLDDYIINLPNSFFMQATLESQNYMINIIKNEIKNCNKVADLYCGIGTYTFPISKLCKVDCFEGSELMTKSIKNNINKLNIKTITPYQKDLFNQPLTVKELNDYDIVAINPPRNGAENQCKFLAKSNVKKVIYVSCDKNSFCNDLKLFKDKFVIKKIELIDQFFWSGHIEVVCALERV